MPIKTSMLRRLRLPLTVGSMGTSLMLSAACFGPLGFGSADALAQDAGVAGQLQRQRASDTPSRAPRPAGQPTDFGDSSAAPDVPGAIPGDDPSVVREDGDETEQATPRAGQRVVRRDGDLTEPEPAQARDGVIDTETPLAPEDGTDPTNIDTRPREDADLFENQPSTVDALLFQIEDTDPILDRRPARLFRFEPYDPIGVKVGSFVLFPELETSGAAFSNVFRASRARSDVAFDVRPSARLVSNWRRHALEFRANGTATFFNEFTTENDRAYTLETRGRIDITRRTNVQATLSQDVSQESRSAPDGRAAGTRADVTTDRATLALNHRFNRLTLQLRGSYTDLTYGDTSSLGVTTNNSSRDYATTEEAVRATWEFKPTLSAFTEVAVNQRDYATRDASGLDRSSNGERYRVGLSFGNTGEILRGEASVGYGTQRPSSRILPEVSGLIVDANVTWRVNALTAVNFNARSDFVESTTVGVGGIRTQAFGVDVRHSFQRYLIGTAGVTVTNSEYVGSSVNEDELRATLGVEYFLNREAVLFSRYAHTTFTSTTPATSYDADEIRFGFRIRQ